MQWLQITENSLPTDPSTGCLVSIFTAGNQFSHSSGLYAPYKKPTQIFGNVRCPILSRPVRRCAAWLTDMKENQTELETENK